MSEFPLQILKVKPVPSSGGGACPEAQALPHSQGCTCPLPGGWGSVPRGLQSEGSEGRKWKASLAGPGRGGRLPLPPPAQRCGQNTQLVPAAITKPWGAPTPCSPLSIPSSSCLCYRS